MLTRCRCAQQPLPRVYTHAYERSCTHVKDPVVHVKGLVDYGNTKINGMHFCNPPLRRRNVAAQVTEELKTVTYATTLPMEERRERQRERVCMCGLPYGSSVDASLHKNVY